MKTGLKNKEVRKKAGGKEREGKEDEKIRKMRKDSVGK